MGHLNIGFYMAKSQEALGGIAAALGMPRAFAPDAGTTLIVKEQHVRFLKEARPPAPLYITGGVVEIGDTEARLVLLMHHRSGELAASFQTVVAHAGAHDERPIPWPQAVRDRADALMTEVPDRARARSINLGPVATQASLDRANALGLRRTGLGLIKPTDCDVFGRMRTEVLMGRISDGIPHIFEDHRPAALYEDRDVGGVALEYRLIHHRWPRAGDRIELRTGWAGVDARTRRLIHWLLDPDSGEVWGTAEAIAVSFDLKARKIVDLTDDELKVLRTKVNPGLTL